MSLRIATMNDTITFEQPGVSYYIESDTEVLHISLPDPDPTKKGRRPVGAFAKGCWFSVVEYYKPTEAKPLDQDPYP